MPFNDLLKHKSLLHYSTSHTAWKTWVCAEMPCRSSALPLLFPTTMRSYFNSFTRIKEKRLIHLRKKQTAYPRCLWPFRSQVILVTIISPTHLTYREVTSRSWDKEEYGIIHLIHHDNTSLSPWSFSDMSLNILSTPLTAQARHLMYWPLTAHRGNTIKYRKVSAIGQ